MAIADTTLDPKAVNAMLYYIDHPIDWVRDILRIEPDVWQAEALQAYASEPRLAIRAGHGVGKTAWESWIILHFLSTRPFCKIPCTAPTLQQLNDVLWAEVQKWLDQSAMKEYLEWTATKISVRGYKGRWFATARTSNKPENLAGFHEEHILFVVDEASGVMDKIFETIEGALTTAGAKLVLCGNPTQNSGVFHDAFFKDRSLYWNKKVSCLDTARVTPEYAERLKRKYREDSDVYRVRVLGEFPKGDPDSLIPLEWVERATMLDLPEPKDRKIGIGVDVARFGDDETVIVGQVGGRKQIGQNVYSKKDTMETAGNVLATAREWMATYKATEVDIKVDDSGVGGGVTDRLNEVVREQNLPYNIIPVNNGSRAKEDDKYANKGTETWHHLRDLLEHKAITLLNDDDAVAQLSTRKFKMTSNGKIQLERKEDMKKRGLTSPDRADALVLAFADESMPEIVIIDPTTVSYEDIIGGASLFNQF